MAVVGLTLIILQTTRDSASPAVAQEATGQLTATVSPEGCGTVTAQLTSDTSTPEPDTEWTFSDNAYVKVTAKAVKGCTFARWNLTLGGQPFWSSSWNPFQLQFIGGLELTAHFTGEPVTTLTGITLSPSTLTLLEGDTATVAVSLDSDPGEAIDVVLTSDATTSDLTFSPATLSWTATGWGDSKTVTLTAVSDATVEDPEAYTLKATTYLATDTDRAQNILPSVATEATLYDRVTLTTGVTGPGSLTPSGTSARGRGQTVTLTAAPNEGKYLRAWGGACTGTDYSSDTCELTIQADASVSVTFGDEPPTPTLFVIASESSTSLQLEWTGYPDGTSSWQYRTRIWRDASPGNWTSWMTIPSSTASTRSYTLTGLTAGTAYEVMIRALGTNSRELALSRLDEGYNQGYTAPNGDLPGIYAYKIIEGDGTTRWRIAGGTQVVVIPDGLRLRVGYWSVGSDGSVGQVLYDTESTSVLSLEYDPETERFSFYGRDVQKSEDGGTGGAGGQSEGTPARDVNALFDQIVNSLEEVALP